MGVVLLGSWLSQPLPVLIRFSPAALLALSILRPFEGLLVVAGLGPMANALSAWCHSPFPGSRFLEQLVVAFVVGAAARGWRSGANSRVTAPAVLLAASAVASAIAVQPALLVQRAPEMSAWQQVGMLLAGDYFQLSTLWQPLLFCALTIEGLALAVTAERIVRANHDAARRTVLMALAGHAGVALLNVEQLVAAAVRSGDTLRALPRLFRDLRVSLFIDVNAAGSVFAMSGVSGLGLLSGSKRWGWAIAIMSSIIALGLWSAGSRAALLAISVTLAVMLCIEVWKRGRRARFIAALCIAILVPAGVWAAVFYESSRNAPVSQAVLVRRIMAETSFNMWRSHPVFGIGIGRFYEESTAFGASALRTSAGAAVDKENAHNYFLQILATEGLVGFASVLVLLATAVYPAIRAEYLAPLPLRRWLLAGIGAYLLTWLTGHPNLVPEAALAFWLLLGVLAALSPAAVATRLRNVLVVVAVIVLATAPFRAAHALRDVGLEHVGIGLSHWQPDLDGLRYRQAGQAFSLYIPADGTSVDLPVRRAPESPDPLVLEIRVEGRKLYDVLISGDAWQQIRLRLPVENRRYRRTDFSVSALGSGSIPTTALYVGKAVPR